MTVKVDPKVYTAPTTAPGKPKPNTVCDPHCRRVSTDGVALPCTVGWIKFFD